MSNPYTVIAPGPWRGELDLRNVQQTIKKKEKTTPSTVFDYRETPSGVLPFNFNVEYISKDSIAIQLINGSERQTIGSYRFKSNVLGAKDSIILNFPIYDAQIKAFVQEGVMQGEYIVHYRDHYSIPFTAHLGKEYRFSDLHSDTPKDVSGRWKVKFTEADGHQYPAIGDFTQDGNYLTGTFETETGDYRYLQGNIDSNQLFLSTFDGAHAFLFEAEITNENKISGKFFSGNHYLAEWTAERDENFELPHLKSLSKPSSKAPYIFSGRTIDQATIAFNEGIFKDKAKIVQIMGSWCPNCYDETTFLQEWQQENPDSPIQIVSIAFERYSDIGKNIRILKQYREKMNLKWPILYGGQYEGENQNLPFIDTLISYPTMIFFDKNNVVRNIYTGFNGPATQQYAGFKDDFNKTVQELLKNND